MEIEVIPCQDICIIKGIRQTPPFPTFCIISPCTFLKVDILTFSFRNHPGTYFNREHTLHTPKMSEQEVIFSTERFHKSSGLQNQVRPEETQWSRKAGPRGKCFKCLKSLLKCILNLII